MFLSSLEVDFILEGKNIPSHIDLNALRAKSNQLLERTGLISSAKYFEAAVLLGLKSMEEDCPLDEYKECAVNYLTSYNPIFSISSQTLDFTIDEAELATRIIEAHLDTGVFTGFLESDYLKITRKSSVKALICLVKEIYSQLAETKSERETNTLTSKEICQLCEEIVQRQIFSDGNHRTAINLYYSLHAEYLKRIPKNLAEEVHGCLTIVRASGDRFFTPLKSNAPGRLFKITTLGHHFDRHSSAESLKSELTAKRVEIEKLEPRLIELSQIGRALQRCKQPQSFAQRGIKRPKFFIATTPEKADKLATQHHVDPENITVISPKKKREFARWQHARAGTGTIEVADLESDTLRESFIREINDYEPVEINGFSYRGTSPK